MDPNPGWLPDRVQVDAKPPVPQKRFREFGAG